MTLTARQFGTTVQVEIIPPSGPGVLINKGKPVQLRVAATVRKGISTPASPSTCAADVYNLGADSRDRAAGVTRRVIDFSDEIGTLDGRLVFGDQFGDGKAEQVSRANGFGFLRVSAFYQVAQAPVALFVGTATSVTPVGSKPTPITRIEGSDGVVQDALAITNRQWDSKVGAPTVLEYAIREVMGTTLVGSLPGNFGAGLPQIVANLEFPAGYDATMLYATDILDAVAEKTNTVWWWDDGDIYWLEQGKALPRAPLILDSTPSADAYQILDKPRPAEDNELEVPLLLLPACRLGVPLNIRSGEFAGEYLVRAVTHIVDNRGSSVAKTIPRLARVGALPFL